MSEWLPRTEHVRRFADTSAAHEDVFLLFLPDFFVYLRKK